MVYNPKGVKVPLSSTTTTTHSYSGSTSANPSKFRFMAQEPKPHQFGFGHCGPRYYEADPLFYQPERFTADVSNGVLLVQIPKIRVGTKTGRICLNVGRFKTHIDVDGNLTLVEQPVNPK